VTADVAVLDYEPVLAVSTMTPTVAENAGTFVAKISRQGIEAADLLNSLIVNLTAGPGLTVPATLTIPSGLTEMTFSVGIIDNKLLDGDRSSSITASKNFYASGTQAIAITDYESVTVTLNKSSFLENAGSKAAIATVHRSDTDNLGQSLLVALESSDATELRVPASVTIPAGQESVTFFVEAVDDSEIDGAKNVTITASSVAYVTGTAAVVVLDYGPPVLTGPNATTTSSRPTISWNAIAGTLRYDVWIDNLSTGVSQLLRNINVPTNSWVPPENLGIGRYRVWVRAIDQLEQPGFWSAARDFYINTSPTITSPKQDLPLVGGKFPTIVWSAVPDATKYELWVDNITNVRVLYKTYLTDTTYTSPTVLPKGSYRVWVRAVSTMGEMTAWSVPVDFVITSLEFPEDSTSQVQLGSLASLIENDGQLTPDGSSAERPDFMVSAADVQTADQFAVAMRTPADDVAISVKAPESAQKFTVEHDTVMSELPLAGWWADDSVPSHDTEIHSAAALAASARFMVRRSSRGSADRRKRNRI